MVQPARHFAESRKAYYTAAERAWVAKPTMKMKDEYWPGHCLFAKYHDVSLLAQPINGGRAWVVAKSLSLPLTSRECYRCLRQQ